MAEKVDIKPMQRRAPIRSSARRQSSAIGEFLFEERRRRNWNQNDVAKHVSGPSTSGKIYNSRVSRIEMGQSSPTDDELLAYADLFKLELDDLIKLRDEQSRPRSASELSAAIDAARAKAATRGRAPEPEEDEEEEDEADEDDELEPVRGAPVAKTLTSRPTPQPALQTMAAFMDAIGAVCPLPLDSEKRRRAWLDLVLELYQLAAPVVPEAKPKPIEREGQGQQHGHGESRAIVLAAADDWSDTSALCKRSTGLTRGTVYTLISALRKEGLLERRGSRGAFEYRRPRRKAV